jgi:hypothetical protein
VLIPFDMCGWAVDKPVRGSLPGSSRIDRGGEVYSIYYG